MQLQQLFGGFHSPFSQTSSEGAFASGGRRSFVLLLRRLSCLFFALLSRSLLLAGKERAREPSGHALTPFAGEKVGTLARDRRQRDDDDPCIFYLAKKKRASFLSRLMLEAAAPRLKLSRAPFSLYRSIST